MREANWLRVARALAVAACGLARVTLAQPVVIEVLPKPIGAAAQLVQARGDSVPELPTAGLVSAPVEEIVRPRATFASGAVVEMSPMRASIQQDTLYTLDASTALATPATVDAYVSHTAILVRPERTLVRPEFGGVANPPTTGGSDPPPNPGTGAGGSSSGDGGGTGATADNYGGGPIAAAGNAEVYSLLRQSVDSISTLRREREAKQQRQLEAERDVRGPTALNAINLLEGLHVDPGSGLSQSQILQIDHNVYGDENPETGFFYFVPKRYDLEWSPEGQYAFTVIYGIAGAKAEEGQVFMAARLRAGVDARELSVAETLMRAYVRRHSNERLIKLRGLRPLPLESATEVSLFGGGSNEFTIPEENISIQAISGLLGTVDVSWATDVRRLLNIESLLRTDAGIHGTLTLQGAGSGKLNRAVPLEISVAAPTTFGRIPFDRAQGWQNATYYPVRLQRLHALLVAPANLGPMRRDEPVVFSWDLENALVPPGAFVRWNGLLIPPWIDSQALVLWATYAVDGSCETCDDRVFNERFIPPPPATRRVVFTTGDVFEATGAYRISVRIRSPFLTPQRNRVVEQPTVTLTQDGEEYMIGKLFLSEREISGSGAAEPLYEYSVEVTMRDGTVYRSNDWAPSREIDLLLGSVALEKMLGTLPRAEAAAAP